jgi:hypothetical protein
MTQAPIGGSAGALIYGLCLRGLRFGTAEVSDKHANFIQVDPGGSADDVAELMALVRARVLSETGVDLHSEVRLVGFDPEVASDAGAQVGGTSNNASSDSSGGTRLDALFGPLVSDDNTLSAVAFSPPLPDEAVLELSELFADTGAIARPDDTPSVADSSQTPVGAVVDISTAIQAREAQQAAAGEPVVIDDAQHLLPHERSEASTGVGVAVSTFVNTAVNTATLGDVIVDDRIGRRTWWKRLPRLRVSPLVGFGVVIAVFSLALVILASPLFAVRQIDITGVTYSDPALLSDVSDSLRGASVFTADLEGAQRRLEGDPWVRQARLNWYLPNRVVIEIEERRAVAWFVGVDNRARVLDIDGRVLEVLDGQPTQFMKIEGVGPNLPPGTVTTLVYQAAAQLANSLPADLLPQLRHVFVDCP